MARRLKAMGMEAYRNGFKVTVHPQNYEAPLRWRKPRVVFVNSMSDLFHEDVPFQCIQNIFDVMCRAGQHTFQILTKRAERLAELSGKLCWSPNIWMGVTVENQECTHRIDSLRKTGAQVKFLSLEPLLSALPKLNLKKIDWVIVGGESGPGARPMRSEWVTDIRDQCVQAKVPFFFKQWGGVNKKKAGRELEGKTWDQMPEIASPLFAGA
jgi:protein gp37